MDADGAKMVLFGDGGGGGNGDDDDDDDAQVCIKDYGCVAVVMYDLRNA